MRLPKLALAQDLHKFLYTYLARIMQCGDPYQPTIEDVIMTIHQQKPTQQTASNKTKISPSGELSSRIQKTQGEPASPRSGGQKSNDKHLPIREA
jgi:hypothetical protein